MYPKKKRKKEKKKGQMMIGGLQSRKSVKKCYTLGHSRDEPPVYSTVSCSGTSTSTISDDSRGQGCKEWDGCEKKGGGNGGKLVHRVGGGFCLSPR